MAKYRPIEPHGKAWNQFVPIYEEAFKFASETPPMLSDKVRSGRYFLVGGFIGRTLVGGAVCSYLKDAGCGYIAFACVDSRRRSQGIGKGLVAEVLAEFGRLAAPLTPPVFAEVHHGRRPEDRARVRFWRREGFQVLGVQWTPIPTPLKLMVRGERDWTPMDLVPVAHEIFKVGYRHFEHYDSDLRRVLRDLLRKPLEAPISRS